MNKQFLELVNINSVEFEFDNQLEKYKKATGEEFCNWEVVHRIYKGEAFLFAPNGDVKSGWIVLEPLVHPMTRKRFVNIWLLYCEQENAVKTFIDDVESLAREIDVEYIEFSTEFEGLARMGEQLYGKPSVYTYRKDL